MLRIQSDTRLRITLEYNDRVAGIVAIMIFTLLERKHEHLEKNIVFGQQKSMLHTVSL
ncbi:MAG: hypothetical protein ABR903_04625 [Thermodesulfovibrionales bacterium]|jgi:hypothetical protein